MDISNIYNAKEVLKDVVSKTPLVHADKLHENLWIKAENLQGADASKLHGTYHKLHSLTQKERERDVIAANAGNHVRGIAYSYMKMGIEGTIVMPKIAPLSKIEAVRSYGVTVGLQGDTLSDTYEYAKNLQGVTGAVFVEPFDDEYVIAGQGAIGPEILNKLSDVDTVIVPISGGGLISGIAVAIKAMRPSCRVIGVQSEHTPSMKQSLKKKETIKLQNISTVADEIAIKIPGKLTYELCSKYVDEVVTVSEEEIATAILTPLEKMKMVAERTGATSVVAAMFGKVDLKHHKYVAVLPGRNIDINLLSKTVDLSLIETGRKTAINMNIMDKPENLSRMIELISRTGTSIISVSHDRIRNAMLFDQCRIGIIIETNDSKHIEDMLAILKNNGYDPYLVEHV